MATPVLDNQVLQQGLSAINGGNFGEAERLFRLVLGNQPRHVAALNLLSIVLIRLGRYSEAEVYLRRALIEKADSDSTLTNYGIVLRVLKRPVEALKQFDQAVAINSKVAETWNCRGIALSDLRRPEEAIEDFGKATKLNPRYAEAWFNKGNSLAVVGRPEEAMAAFEKALELQPDWAAAWLAYGNALCEAGRRNEGLAAYDRALRFRPDLVAAQSNRGAVLLDLRRYEEALVSCDSVIAFAPDLVVAHANRGGALLGLKRYSEALVSADRTILLDEGHAEGWLIRGNVFTALKQYADAFGSYNRALNLRPNLAEAFLGRGRCSMEQEQYEEALSSFDQALTLKPQLAEAWFGRGAVLSGQTRYEDAVIAFDRALALNPDLDEAAGSRLMAKLYTCTWANIEADTEKLLVAVRAGKLPSVPFPLLAIASSAADQLRCAKRYVQKYSNSPPWRRVETSAHRRIRIAYLSSDFCEHPVAALVVSLLENHDKAGFDITAISFGPDDKSEVRSRIMKAADHFIDTRHKSDQEITDIIRSLQIDIAIDLNGFTGAHRAQVLANRIAPVQVNYLGFSATTGADYMDYIFADRMIIPEGQTDYYSEQVVWLPETFQVNDDKRLISEHTPSRQQLNLPESAFVFCCFNNSYKFAPEIFDIWMRLLRKIEGSVLWLRKTDAIAARNLCLEAQRRGVSEDRLVFAQPVRLMADHLARQRQADLFLDTLPYNAHTTTSDALWAGLPVLTCLGETFAGRVAASLLKSAGLDDMVTHSLEEYEATATRLASSPVLLKSIRDRLSLNRSSCALFDTKRAVRQFESAYEMIWERYQRDEKPPAPGQHRKPIQVV